MKFRRLKSFNRDFETLPQHIQEQAKQKFEIFRQHPMPPYHGSLRIKKMKGFEGVWEGHVTGAYVFTFEQIQDEKSGETIFQFRRIGTHEIYDNP